jgi:transmembrane sensor
MSRTARKQASRWLLRLQGEAVSPADRSAFEAWYRAHSEHAAAFDALTTTVDRLRQLRARIAADPAPSPPAFQRSRRSMLAAVAGGALAASFVGFVWIAGVAPWGEETLSLEAGLGVQRQVKLADGSQVELNTGTSLDVRMSATSRRVKLAHGEALFKVAHEAQRPFEVEVAGHVVRAVGTEFSVRADANATTLLVIEGKVSVAPAGGGAPQLVSAAERFDLVDWVRTTALSTKDIERALAWRRGMLEFDGASLDTVVAEVERYTGAHFIFADPALADLPMVTYFRAADLNGFISRLESSYPLLSVRAGNDGYLIYRRPEAAR